MSEYEIKVDGEQHQYESGAVRYNKNKGDFNLIPRDVVHHMLEFIDASDGVLCSYNDHLYYTIQNAFDHDYEETIVQILIEHYLGFDITNDQGDLDEDVYFDKTSIMEAFAHMLRDLAIHYQKGARTYGVDNWKKGIEDGTGIPESSFFDSGVRHTLQFICGEEDEPHHISAIWNFFAAIYIREKFYEK